MILAQDLSDYSIFLLRLVLINLFACEVTDVSRRTLLLAQHKTIGVIKISGAHAAC